MQDSPDALETAFWVLRCLCEHLNSRAKEGDVCFLMMTELWVLQSRLSGLAFWYT